MSTLLEILIHDILPLFIAIGLGYGFARRSTLDTRVLSRLTFYIFSPSLVFVSLVESDVESGEIAQLAAFVLIVTLVMGGLAWLTARLMRLSPKQTAGFLLASMFVNAGNYGLGVTRLAFGEAAEARAVIYFVSSSVLVYTLGVLIATGFAAEAERRWRGILKQLFSLPHIYALTAALIVRATGWQLPSPVIEGLRLPAQAAIPMMLVLLGMQLANASVNDYWRPALVSSSLRLFIAPFIAAGLAALIGLNGPARQAGVLEASMPAAVINTLIAAEFQSEPKLVTGTVVLSTLMSPFTLSIIIALLR